MNDNVPANPDAADGARSDARGAETRTALIASGRRLFARKGFDGASVRDITRDAGVNLGAITYHFGSKRALYEAVLVSGLGPMVDRVGAVADGPGTPVERLRGVIDAFFEHMGKNQELPRLLLQEVAAGKQPPAAVLAILRRNAANVVRIVSEGWNDGTLRRTPPLLTALSVVAQPIYMTIMAPLLKEIGGIDLSDPETRRQAAEHVKDVVHRGLAVQEASE